MTHALRQFARSLTDTLSAGGRRSADRVLRQLAFTLAVVAVPFVPTIWA
jgi:hypothetical protein